MSQGQLSGGGSIEQGALDKGAIAYNANGGGAVIQWEFDHVSGAIYQRAIDQEAIDLDQSI